MYDVVSKLLQCGREGFDVFFHRIRLLWVCKECRSRDDYNAPFIYHRLIVIVKLKIFITNNHDHKVVVAGCIDDECGTKQ